MMKGAKTVDGLNSDSGPRRRRGGEGKVKQGRFRKQGTAEGPLLAPKHHTMIYEKLTTTASKSNGSVP